MIDYLRSLVLSILNKNNYGAINVSDFNYFVKNAQLAIFSGYADRLNELVNMENKSMLSDDLITERAAITESIEKMIVIDSSLTRDSGNVFNAPTEQSTGHKIHTMIGVDLYNSGAFMASAEKVGISTALSLSRSSLTAQSMQFPTYSNHGDKITIFPSTFSEDTHTAKCHFVRYPKDPKWTYQSISGGAPVFNPSAGDYQDIELKYFEIPRLATMILMQAGLKIREADVMNFYSREEAKQKQEELD